MVTKGQLVAVQRNVFWGIIKEYHASYALSLGSNLIPLYSLEFYTIDWYRRLTKKPPLNRWFFYFFTLNTLIQQVRSQNQSWLKMPAAPDS